MPLYINGRELSESERIRWHADHAQDDAIDGHDAGQFDPITWDRDPGIRQYAPDPLVMQAPTLRRWDHPVVHRDDLTDARRLIRGIKSAIAVLLLAAGMGMCIWWLIGGQL